MTRSDPSYRRCSPSVCVCVCVSASSTTLSCSVRVRVKSGLPGFLFTLLRFQFKAWFGILQSSILITCPSHLSLLLDRDQYFALRPARTEIVAFRSKSRQQNSGFEAEPKRLVWTPRPLVPRLAWSRDFSVSQWFPPSDVVDIFTAASFLYAH